MTSPPARAPLAKRRLKRGSLGTASDKYGPRCYSRDAHFMRALRCWDLLGGGARGLMRGFMRWGGD